MNRERHPSASQEEKKVPRTWFRHNDKRNEVVLYTREALHVPSGGRVQKSKVDSWWSMRVEKERLRKVSLEDEVCMVVAGSSLPRKTCWRGWYSCVMNKIKVRRLRVHAANRIRGTIGIENGA